MVMETDRRRTNSPIDISLSSLVEEVVKVWERLGMLVPLEELSDRMGLQ